MLRTFVLLLTALVGPLALLARSDDTQTPSALERDPSGWTDLLAKGGPELKGWVRGPIPPKGKLNPHLQWSIDAKTGHLICDGDGGHEWLRWDHPFADGVFHVEWRFTKIPGKKGYNSGMYARNSADARIWHQAQTGDASGGFLFGQTEENGKLKSIHFPKQKQPSRVKPAGEWNTFELACHGKEVTLWVNGAITADWTDCPVPEGYVGLEAEGYRIEFRNVKLKVLD